MCNLFYPQLISGALAQYPISKTKTARTIKNVLQDGTMLVLPDPSARWTAWQLEYSCLSLLDVQALQAHFQSCKGPLSAFTFIDPIGNMLVSSVDLTTVAWQRSSILSVQTGITDPLGDTSTQTVTNYGQSAQEVTQSLAVPANYQYCFSLYAAAIEQTHISVFRRGLNSQQSTKVSVGPGWTRIVSSGRLNDSGFTLTVGISFDPGTQISVFGTQLEAQISPSRYQPTCGTGGVYPNAHWATEHFQITANGINSYATTVSIETAG